VNGQILFVDDDPSVLAGYRRTLHGLFQIDLAASAREALERLTNRGPFDVVVSGMHMKGMNGIAFLSEVGATYPLTVGMILTAYADIETAIAAVNDGHVFRFLTKPCSPEALKKAVTACLEQHCLLVAEKECLEQTITGCIKVFADVLSLANPCAFRRAVRIRRYVLHLVERMDLESAWQYEVAAMLSQLGCIALPPEIIEAAYRGKRLSSEEQTLFDMHPSVARSFLHHIPRMDAVAWMIGQQRFGAAIPNSRVSAAMRAGVDILRLAIAMDDLRIGGLSDEEAMARIREDPQFDPDTVAALAGIPREESSPDLKAIAVSELADGMILQEEIRTRSGILLAERGQEVTYPLIVRLNNFDHRKEMRGKILVSFPAPASVPGYRATQTPARQAVGEL